MRKFYAALLTLFSLVLWSTKSDAQASLYTFAQSSGTYTAISGTIVHASGWDDNVSSVAIPFSFSFNGTAYSSVFVNSNGHLTFGTTSPGTTNYNPISSTIAYDGAVSAFGRDLISNSTTIEQTTIGSTPNRQFIVQWNNARRYSGGGVAGDVLNFQIILYETSNVIQVVYGTCTATSTTSLACQVGLRGASNADFNNRTTTTDWSATIPGAANTASCTSLNTIMPASGLTFTWLPPSPCSPGSLVGGTTQGPASFCAGGTFTLSVSGASAGTGLTYEWQTSPDGTSWSPASGINGNTTYAASISANTYFRRKTSCSGTDAFSTSLFVTVSTTPTPLTEAFTTYATTFPPTCWNITNATYTTGQSPSAYGFGTGSAKFDFYNSSTGTLLDLISPVLVPVPANYRLKFDHAYATFFSEVDQLQILYSTNGGTSYTNLITYLGGATGPLNTFGGSGGTTGSFAPTASQWARKIVNLPAGTNRVLFRGVSAFGNNLFIDNITIEPVPSCLPPTGLTTTGIAPTAATLSWTASTSNPSNGYQWEVRTTGAPGSGAVGLVASGSVPAGTTTASATGLTANTTYNFYILSDCGAGNLSEWTIPGGVFTTPCNAFPLPLQESFTTATFPPTCWNRNDATLLIRNAASSFGIGSGSAKFDFYDASSGTNLDLITPPFTAVSGSYFLVFDHAYATFVGENDRLQILYSTDGGVSYTNLITYNGGTSGPLNTGGSSLPSFTPTASQWATKVIALPAGANRLLFRGISAFGNNLYIDNITITSCIAPSGLGLSAISPTTTTLSWTASTSNPSNGYQYEVRTSGAPGSGATGLAASGTTPAGVTTASVTGLTPFTAYTYYVRSDCGGSDFSVWISYSFTTPCTPIAVPFAEDFATYSTTFPPNCWLRNDATYLTGQSPSAYGIGLGSAKFDFYNAASGTQLNLESPLFNPTPAGWGVIFDHAYSTFAGEVDSLRIMYSTNGGGSYQYLTSYAGGGGGPLNTGGGNFSAFVPTASQWANKAILLPAGTNRLLFKGVSAFGNNLYLDNIAIVSCLPPNNVKAQGISPTEVVVTFSSPGTQFIVEYGAPGFTPGAGNTAGTGGTAVFTAASPTTISGLNPSTAYDFYIRQICTPGVDYSINVKAPVTTLCPATNIPYLQNFESAVVPAMPNCTSSQDVNGNSGSFWFGTGGGSWETYTDGNPLTYVSPSTALLYFYDFNDLSRGGDDWFYTQGLNLTAGTKYRLKFFYKALDGVNFPERMEVKYGTKAYAANMTSGTVFINNNISSTYAGQYDSVQVDFTPTSTGVFYLGFHSMSFADEFGILVDDIGVKVSPLVDVGITGITLPSLNCPTNGVFVQATIRNYNLTPINFATYPVTITANITGAGTGTLTTILNSGTLAPNAEMTVYLNPAFNFSSGGLYTVNVATSSTFDTEPQNDAFSALVNVNPNPATPVITPSSLQLCIGGIGQLTTQFTPPPPAVTLPAFSSGTISVPVPDGSAAGATHSLNVTGIPAGASIISMSVTLNMTHTWAGDMIFNLKAPNGNILNLDKYIGGTDASGLNFVNTVISSATGLPPLSSAAAPRTGTFRPDAINTAVAVSNIQNPTGYVSNAASFAELYSVPNGTWTLAMADGVGFDAGTLTSWSIIITYQVLTPTITWTPTAGLYTNATGTAAYTGGNAYSLYAGPTATTNYTITATTVAGCTSSATALVTVNLPPVVTIGNIPDTVCISDPIIPLAASPAGGTWSGIGVSGNNFIPPATAIGNYTLTYTYISPAGCPGTATKKIVVKDCPERMILLRDNAVILYPNPNSGRFNIKINSVLYNNLGMRVYTNNGTLVRTQQFSGLAWGRVIPVDLTNLPGGLYMIKFYYEGGPRTAEKTFKVMIGTD
jgi:subtilisin-like proprotein convertase family protein